MPDLQRDGLTYVLNLGDSDNAFNPGSLQAFSAMLDEVEHAAGPRALVTTGSGKIFSNGLDLGWMRTNRTDADEVLGAVHRIFARLLGFPVPTVAAIQGHAFAAGAMLALCHDRQIMRADRGFWCLPEVDLGLPFSEGMTSLLRSRLNAGAAREAMISGRRYSGIEAVAAGIVEEAIDESDRHTAAFERAVMLAGSRAPQAGAALGAIKSRLHAEAIRVLLMPARMPEEAFE